jgi:hypothetical protein
MARIEILQSSEDGITERTNRTETGGVLAWVQDDAHKYNNTGKEILRITKGAGAATMTMTTEVPDKFGLQLPDREVAIAANSTKHYAGYPRAAHNERSGADEHYTSIAFSNVTGLEVAVVRLAEEIA